MKHTLKITLLILGLFIATQLLGLVILNDYRPEVLVFTFNGTEVNQTVHNLPYGLEPPQQEPAYSLISFIIAFILAIGLMVAIMKSNLIIIMRIWFAIVIVLALSVSLYALLPDHAAKTLSAGGLALLLAAWKLGKGNKYIHNATEVLVYPGIAALLVPILSVSTIFIILILMSLYDAWAVWHSGFMQKLAHYQMQEVKIFSGLFIPYMVKGTQALLHKARKTGKMPKGLKIQVAILGGGDLIFPLLCAGTVFFAHGLIPALFIIVGSTLALAYLLLASQKGKFYPALPYLTVGCVLGYLPTLVSNL
ncbi:hypothetical protein EXS73_03720 [Candidatus Pacearchaeota archaeon]|nr:hypothetical protein [Candidatus Pacearchaeota archaeon]